ncbi:SusC/RagA family TonB-linked outer membrane protein [Aquiflexum sp. TKW24L]|uniref:SusC/RagA family TonB-linked outer membrane protein n=1 Tax=Aquiflexum sp. TKW24L TaxID=2942212 RepID=UPI0020BD9C9E|nr:SusC/RagA family TonB-linked outer membrane protein [Aquiflexum sp. TKW24L]MCL6260997.1 SusC/RagA family TonB-linked outer membrane protein [Aquiflexum sp. TKW24L]
MKRKFTIFILIFFGIFSGIPELYAQNVTIKGKVTSREDGLPLPGVTILVQNTTVGSVTDIDGNYSVNVPTGSNVLTFSFIGFENQSVQINNRTTIDVIMVTDTRQLSEVVVTAFGIEQQKKSLVSATQEVKSQEISLSREGNIVDALNAKVAGVQITRQGGSAGAASSIIIRGMSSISGENQPLFVIDGIPVNNDFRTRSRSSGVDVSNRAVDINPNDIESINVLKGPAATSLYGIQAASGVIIITTKKGARSEGQNLQVNFSSNIAGDRIMQNFPAQMTYAQGDNGLYGTTTFGHFGPPLTTLRYNGATNNPANPRGFLVDMNDPSAVANATLTPVNNQDLFFQTGLTIDNNLSVSAGNKYSSLFLSVGDFRQSGIIPNNDFGRTSFKITGESSLTDKLKVTASATYVHSTSTRFGRGDNFADVVQGTIRTPPSFNNAEGFLLPNGGQRAFRNNSPDNSFWTINNNPFSDEVNRMIGFIQTNYQITPWLSAMYRLGTDVSSDKRNQRWAVGSFGGDALPGGRVQEQTFNDRLVNSDLIVTATKKVNDVNFTALVGNNFFSRSFRDQFFDGRNLAIPGLYNISNAQTNLVQTQFQSLKKTAALFSRVSVDYKNYLFLELNGRNEWTSTLRPPNNSFFYGSVGTGFVFTEAFNLDQGAFSFGKLRASYSEAGRDAPVYTDQTYYDRASVSGVWGGGLVFPLPSGIGGSQLSASSGNPNLRPERNRTWEFGGEFRFLENKLGLDITYYRERTEDQIIFISVPGSTGFSTQIINAGTIQNKGWEIIGNATLVDRAVKWDMIANFSRNRNVVLELPVDRIALAGFGNLRPLVKEGEPYGVFYGTGFRRDANGEVVIGANGYPMREMPSQSNPSGDLKIGDPTPDFLLGLRNNLSYKNFLLSFLWDFRIGGDVANVTTNWMRAQGVGAFTEDRGSLVVFRGVKEDGTPNTQEVLISDAAYYNNATGNRDIAERFIEDGTWIRLRDINLSYSVPREVANRLKMRSLNVSLYARNVLLLTGYSGVDPETNLGGPNSSMGVDAFGTPTTRSMGINLSLGF